MSQDLKNEITLIQIQFLKAIKSHQACYEKLKDGEDNPEMNDELQLLQTIIRECQERQKSLLEQLKKQSGDAFKFNLYKIPTSSADKGKKRRRKDLSLTAKSEKKNPPTPTRSHSPTPEPNIPPSSPEDSLSSDSDSDVEISQSSLPMPLPRARPKLLPNGTQSLPISRYGKSKLFKVFRRPRSSNKHSDESTFREIPIIPEPPPSPEPVNEYESKMRFMMALNLIPTESLPEILSKKSERKRRSTANTQFVYNDDWDLSLKKKNKQYLSPTKAKVSILNEKSSAKDKGRECRVDDTDSKKSSLDEGLENGDSNSQPEGDGCVNCGASEPMLDCQDCDERFHAKCPKIPLIEQSFLVCRLCRKKTVDSRIKSVEDSPSKQSKTVPSDVRDKFKLRDNLLTVLRNRMEERAMLEREVLQLSDNLMLQNKLKKDLVIESQDLYEKTEQLRQFVISYQKTGVKIETENPNLTECNIVKKENEVEGEANGITRNLRTYGDSEKKSESIDPVDSTQTIASEKPDKVTSLEKDDDDIPLFGAEEFMYDDKAQDRDDTASVETVTDNNDYNLPLLDGTYEDA